MTLVSIPPPLPREAEGRKHICLLYGIGIVHAPGLPEVLDQILASVPPPLHIEGLAPQPRSDLVQLFVLNHSVCNIQDEVDILTVEQVPVLHAQTGCCKWMNVRLAD